MYISRAFKYIIPFDILNVIHLDSFRIKNTQ